MSGSSSRFSTSGCDEQDIADSCMFLEQEAARVEALQIEAPKAITKSVGVPRSSHGCLFLLRSFRIVDCFFLSLFFLKQGHCMLTFLVS